MSKQWMLVCVLGVGLWSGGSWTPAQTPPDLEDEEPQLTEEQQVIIYERGVKLLQRTGHGRFVLAGSVVDPDGKPVPEVSMRVGMSQMTGWGWDTSKDTRSDIREEILKDGRFRLDVSPYYSVTLWFTKPGYYEEMRDFRYEKRMQTEEEREEIGRASLAIMRGEDVKVKEGVYRDENIRVVMEKIGQVMTPVMYGGPLVYAPGYGGSTAQITYIDFTIPPLKDYKLQKMSSLGELTNLPAAIAYAIAETDEEGRVAHEMIKLGTFRPEAYAKRIYVRINDPEGGFIEYVPKAKEFAF